MNAGLRRLWRVPLVASWVLFGLLLASLLRLWPLRWRPTAGDRMTICWMQGLLRLLPLRIQRYGQPMGRQAVWVANHVSWLDIILLGASSPLRFIAKSEVRQWPLLGWLADSAGTLFIRRGQAGNIHSQLEMTLDQGRSLMIFAEGTTTLGDRVRTFHGRLLSSAVARKVPVQPIALRYQQNGELSRDAAFIDDDELPRHLWRLLGSPTIEVEVHFLPLISSHNLERNEVARRAHQAVVQALALADGQRRQGADSVSTAV